MLRLGRKLLFQDQAIDERYECLNVQHLIYKKIYPIEYEMGERKILPLNQVKLFVCCNHSATHSPKENALKHYQSSNDNNYQQTNSSLLKCQLLRIDIWLVCGKVTEIRSFISIPEDKLFGGILKVIKIVCLLF